MRLGRGVEATAAAQQQRQDSVKEAGRACFLVRRARLALCCVRHLLCVVRPQDVLQCSMLGNDRSTTVTAYASPHQTDWISISGNINCDQHGSYTNKRYCKAGSARQWALTL